MIRFFCPRCKSVLEQPDNAGGTKVACPQCGQRLQVPFPPANKTILGDLVASGMAPQSEPFPADARIRSVDGRQFMAWSCPLCQNQVEAALDLAQPSIRCPHCARKIQVPPAPNPLAPPPPGPPSPPPLAVPPPPLPAATTSWAYHDHGPSHEDRGPPRRAYRSRHADDEDEDDFDYRPVPRKPARYQPGYSTWAATSGFVCSLISLAILVLCFIFWILITEDHRGGWNGNAQEINGIVFLFLMATLASFILGILGVVFSSRGMDSSNDHNRGLALAGLICGIIGLVLSVIFAIPFLMCGMVIWLFRGFC